jgi:DNA repair exonuclease SbcCD nuclease subunit
MLAFYRTKRVRGKEYRQLVENYRDESGKHKQRVLAHLGRYETVEEAAEYFEGFAATSCKSAEEHRAKAQEHAERKARRVQFWKERLQELESEEDAPEQRTERLRSVIEGASPMVEDAAIRKELEQASILEQRADTYTAKATNLRRLIESGKAAPDSEEVRQKRQRMRKETTR